MPFVFILAILTFQSGVGRAATGDSFAPSNPPEMKPLANRDSPAYQAARLFMHGVNLGNYLEAPPGRNWGVTFPAEEVAIMRAEGFDHVRVPIGWQHYTGPAPDFALAPEIFARVDFVVTNALAGHLAVMINIHHFDELDHDPAGSTEEFLAIWRQIAAHYRNFPNQLAFELDNEPHENAKTAVMNPIEPGNWGSIEELKNLVLPPDDNLIVSVHCYDPMHFTHQGASWAGPDERVTGIQFPGPPAKPLVPDPALKLSPQVRDWIQRYNTLPTEKNPSSPMAFEGKIKLAREWSDYYGRPVQLGEFGCYTRADPASRARFYAAFRQALDREHVGWTIWDWSAGFRYWDKPNNRPMPGMREALFGK